MKLPFANASIRAKSIALCVSIIVLNAIAILSGIWWFLERNNERTAMAAAQSSLRTLAVLVANDQPAVRFDVVAERIATFRVDAMPSMANHDLVDQAAVANNGVATLFVKNEEGAFIRRSTNVKKENGERAVGTALAPDHPAQALLKAGKPYYGPATLFGRSYFTGYHPVVNQANSVIGVLFVGTPTEQLAADLRDVILGVVGIILLVALVLSLLSLYIVGRAVKPIAEATRSLKMITSGDLDALVETSTRLDEIGDLIRAVHVFRDTAQETRSLEQSRNAEQAAKERRANQLADAIGEFERSVTGVVDFVETASAKLQKAATDLTGSTGEMQNKADFANVNSQHASSNVQAVAAAADQLTSSVREISRQVQHSMEKAKSTVGQATSTNEKVKELMQSSDRIGEVVKLITDVAEQTNLLALNATIEAARAGELGKGFAVVASEVKALAGQTAKATEAIQQQILSMQSVTRDTAASIQVIGTSIVEIAEISTAIAAAVEEQGAATGEISRNVQEAATKTVDVAASISEVTASAANTGRASGQVLESADQLAAQGSKLKSEVETFLKAVRAA